MAAAMKPNTDLHNVSASGCLDFSNREDTQGDVWDLGHGDDLECFSPVLPGLYSLP